MGHFRVLPSLLGKIPFSSNHVGSSAFSSFGRGPTLCQMLFLRMKKLLIGNNKAFLEKKPVSLIVRPESRIALIEKKEETPSRFNQIMKVCLAVFGAAAIGRIVEKGSSGSSEGRSSEKQGDKVGLATHPLISRADLWRKIMWKRFQRYCRDLKVERAALRLIEGNAPDRSWTMTPRECWLRSHFLGFDLFDGEPFCLQSEELKEGYAVWRRPVPIRDSSLFRHLLPLDAKGGNSRLSSPTSLAPIPGEGSEEAPPTLPLELLCLNKDSLREVEGRTHGYPEQVLFYLTFLSLGNGGTRWQRAARDRTLARAMSYLASLKPQVFLPYFLVDLAERGHVHRRPLVRRVTDYLVDLFDEVIARDVKAVADAKMERNTPECSHDDFVQVLEITSSIKRWLENGAYLRMAKSGKEPGVQAMIELGTYRSQGNGLRVKELQQRIGKLSPAGIAMLLWVMRGMVKGPASISFFRESPLRSESTDVVEADHLPRGVAFVLAPVMLKQQPVSEGIETIPLCVTCFRIFRCLFSPFGLVDRVWNAWQRVQSPPGSLEGSDEFKERIQSCFPPHDPVRAVFCPPSPSSPLPEEGHIEKEVMKVEEVKEGEGEGK